MMDFPTLEEKIRELGTKGGIPLNYLKIFNRSLQDGTPHVEINDETYDYIVEERGFEFFRRRTSNLDDLLFWILDDALSKYAFDYELKHRVLNQDSRRIAFRLKIETMEAINPVWGIRVREDIDETLRESPYVD